MINSNPYDSIPCYFCNGGCFCTGNRHSIVKSEEERFLYPTGSVFKSDEQLAKEREDCVTCDVCEGTGELSRKQVDEIATHYKADESFKLAWRSGRDV